jgi:hypothetical protein
MKINLRETGYEDHWRVELAQDHVHQWAFVVELLNLRFPVPLSHIRTRQVR